MTETEHSAPAVFSIAKIVLVNADRNYFHLRFPSGNFTTFSTHQPQGLAVGDVVFLSDTNMLPVPAELWIEPDGVGVIRNILPSGEVIIERSLGIEKVSNAASIEISVGNTVTYRSFEGVRDLVSESPIGVRDFDPNSDDPAAAYRIDTSESDLTFDDFGGYQEVVSRAQEIIETQFKKREHLDAINAKPIKGIMFTGPPGTGKTLLARIIAARSDAEFFLVSGPSIVSKWVGDSEETLRQIFKAAASSQRAIIFFDEIDSLAEKRSGDSHEASKRLVAQLLTLMDGFNSAAGNVIIIAATNRITVIDDALRRPGRFDWEIEFGMPTPADRLDILIASMRKLSISGDMPLEEIANRTDGWSAARLASLWTEAALLAAADSRDAISDEDLVLGFERVRRLLPGGTQ